MFLNVSFYAFKPNFESNLGCFSALFLVRFRGAFRGHVFIRKTSIQSILTVLCSLLLFIDSSQFSLTHRLPHKNKKAGCFPTWPPSLVDL